MRKLGLSLLNILIALILAQSCSTEKEYSTLDANYVGRYILCNKLGTKVWASITDSTEGVGNSQYRVFTLGHVVIPDGACQDVEKLISHSRISSPNAWWYFRTTYGQFIPDGADASSSTKENKHCILPVTESYLDGVISSRSPYNLTCPTKSEGEAESVNIKFKYEGAVNGVETRTFTLSKGTFRDRSGSTVDTKARIEKIKKEIKEKEDSLRAILRKHEAEKQILEEIISNIESKTFSEITEDDLRNYTDAVNKLAHLRKGIDGKQEDIVDKKEELERAVDEIRELIEGDLISEGYDYTEEDFFDTPVDFSLIIDNASSPGVNPFDIWADNAISDFKYKLGNDQETAFFEDVRLWTIQADSFISTVSLTSSSSPQEIVHLENAIKKVRTYLYGSETVVGVLDQDQWFKNSPVPVEYRENLASALKVSSDPNLTRIANSIRRWRSNDGKLTENQKSILVLSYGISNFAHTLKALAPPKKEDFPESDPVTGLTRDSLFSRASEAYQTTLLNYRKSLVEIADAVQEGVDLRVGLSPLSPAKAFCEIISQRKYCSSLYKEVDTVDNLLNVVEMFPYIGVAADSFKGFKVAVLGDTEVFGSYFSYLKDAAAKLYSITPKPSDFVSYIKRLGFEAKKEFEGVFDYLSAPFPDPESAAVKLSLVKRSKYVFDDLKAIGITSRKAQSKVLEAADDIAELRGKKTIETYMEGLRAKGFSEVEVREAFHQGVLRRGASPFGENWTRYVEFLTGTKRPGSDVMENAHGHHLAQKGLETFEAEENRKILEEVGINVYLHRENLTWAPNIGGQHGEVPQRELYKMLSPVKGNREGVIRVLREWAKICAARVRS